MNIKTIIRIYDVLVNDGYKAEIMVTTSKGHKEWGFIKLTFKKGRYKETLFSDTCSTKYILKNLDGRPFECKII